MNLAIIGITTGKHAQVGISLKGLFMETGAKLNLTRTIRSAKTGMLLPREGTLLSMTENLGRTLLLVEFENGQHEYVFEHEVEFKNGTASRPAYNADSNAHQLN